MERLVVSYNRRDDSSSPVHKSPHVSLPDTPRQTYQSITFANHASNQNTKKTTQEDKSDAVILMSCGSLA
jgi:hypothetical protein